MDYVYIFSKVFKVGRPYGSQFVLRFLYYLFLINSFFWHLHKMRSTKNQIMETEFFIDMKQTALKENFIRLHYA